MLTAEEILRLIQRNKEKIWKYGVKRIGSFGSYLKGEQRDDSDIDILVEFEKDKKTFDNYMELKFFLEELFKRKIDLVIAESIKPELRKYIMESVRYTGL